MNLQKEQLIKAAKEMYQDISPCVNKAELADCFTSEGNILMFWFNTNDESTHMLSMDLQ